MKTSKLFIFVSLAASFLILAIATTNIWKEREQALNEAQQRLSDFSLIQAEQMERSLQSVDLVLSNTVGELGRTSDWKSREMHHHLRSFAIALPQIRAVTVVSADGIFVNDSAEFPAQPISIADREYFTFLKNHPGHQGMYISTPLKSRYDQEWAIMLARAVTDKDGTFQGIVTARMSPKYFQENYKKILHNDSSALSVLHRNGTMMFRQPHDEKSMGQSFANQAIFTTLLPASDHGTFEKRAEVGKKIRIFGYHALINYPLVVVAHQEKSTILAPWRDLATRASALLGIVFLLGFYLMKKLFLSLRQRDHDIAAILASEQHLRFITDNMQDIVWTWESDKGITYISPSIKRVLGYTPDELQGRQLSGLCAQSTLDKVEEKFAEARLMFDAGEPPPIFDLTFESQIPNKSGTKVWMENRLRLFTRADAKQFRIQGLSRDITEHKRTQQQLERLANFDVLTGLPNRAMLSDRMRLEMSRAKRHQHILAICFLDLDNFKPINDQHGHLIGDQLLVEVAERLKKAVREEDMVARLGGDEFVLLLADLDQAQEVKPMLQRVLEDIAAPYDINNIEMHISASIGVALYPTHGENPDILLRYADQAMYQAKQTGRNRFYQFDGHITGV